VSGRSEYFAAGRVEKAGRFGKVPDNLEQAQGCHADTVHGGFGELEADARARLPCEVVKLVRLCLGDDASEMGGVLKRSVVEKQPLAQDFGIVDQRPDVARRQRFGTVHQSVDFVVLL